MKVCGVIAEFNPFHYGHKYQLDNISADIKIAVISPDFVQRGDAGILNQKDKAKIALKMGYDIVVSIPTKYAIQNAEVFCTYACRILETLKVDTQVFGAETDDIDKIYKMMGKLENSILLGHLKSGFSYNKSCELALGNLSYLYTSNNILAMEYLRAIKKYNLHFKPLIIKRKDVGYNSESVIGNITSATNIRKKIYNGEDISSYIPYDSKYIYNINYENKLYSLFKYIILTRKIENIYDLNQDILNKLKKEVKKAKDYNTFLKLMSSRNISINRIKRLMLNIVIDIKVDDINKEEEIEYIKVIGINSKGAKYIKNIEKAIVNFKNIKDATENKFRELYNYLFDSYHFTNTIYYESGEDVHTR